MMRWRSCARSQSLRNPGIFQKLTPVSPAEKVNGHLILPVHSPVHIVHTGSVNMVYVVHFLIS